MKCLKFYKINVHNRTIYKLGTERAICVRKLPLGGFAGYDRRPEGLNQEVSAMHSSSFIASNRYLRFGCLIKVALMMGQSMFCYLMKRLADGFKIECKVRRC